jgi:uncharacterized SAM-binding protein YcdF (DUF218 family)
VFILKILFTLACFILFVFCHRTVRRQARKSMYSYRLISTVGLGVFALGLFFASFFEIFEYIGDGYVEQYTFGDLIYEFMTMFPYFLYFAMPFVTLVAAVLVISNIFLIRKEGKSPRNMLGIFVGGAVFLSMFVLAQLIHIVGNFMDTQSFAGQHIYQVIENFLAIIIVYFECNLAATVYVTSRAGVHKPSKDKEYMVVLGCYVLPDGKPGGVLRKRIEAAETFAGEQKTVTGKAPVIIGSGGQGDDEPISEARCIKNYLKQNHYAGKVLIEDESTTTRQNFLYSKKLAHTTEKVAFATTDYHVFRSGVIATKQGFRRPEGIGAKSPWYFYQNAMIREFIASIRSEYKMHLFNIIALNLFSIAVVLIGYLFNLA